MRYVDESYIVMRDKLLAGDPLDRDEAAMFLRTHHNYSHDQAEAAVDEAASDGTHVIKGPVGSAMLLLFADGGYTVDK